VSPKLTPHDVQYFSSAAALRDWFEANARTATELWLGQYRKSTGKPSLSWSEAVDECLCVGWIDGVRYTIDDERFAQRLTPRRPGSNWSAINVAKVASLTEQGRMRPAGIAAFEARRPEKTGVYSYEREAAALEPDELAALQGDAAAWAFWERQPPSYRRTATFWVTSVVRPETRARRLATLIADSAAGRRVAPLARPQPGAR
jgi:uncharacterized protein YdeI (YjbR/CyaY-like superfamily)